MTRPGASARRGRKDRRRGEHGYPSVGALYEHFGALLPRDLIVTAVREAITDFVPRDGSGMEDTRLQLLSKCERSLKLLAGGAAGPEAGPGPHFT